LTDDELLAAYAEWMRSWGARPRTIDARIGIARSRLRDWAGLDGLTAKNIREWLARPQLKSDWSRATYYGHIKAFCDWLYLEGIVDENPIANVRQPTPPKSVPRPLSEAEVRRVLEVAKGDERAWLLLALNAGLRAHEIAKLKGEDVTETSIYVVGKGGKPALLPTHPDVWALAEQYPRQGWWFPYNGDHIPGRLISLSVGKLFDDLGIEGSLHRCRHSYATRLLRAGVHIRRVQKLMRHANLDTTAAYTAVDEDELREAVLRLPSAS
jgi:integrase/recombinase XerD